MCTRTIRGIRKSHGLTNLNSSLSGETDNKSEDTELNTEQEIQTSYAGLWIFLPLILKASWFQRALKMISFKNRHKVTVP